MGRHTSYKLQKTHSPMVFEFISDGPKGTIKKRIAYEEIGEDFYNLAFGDVNPITNDFDDTTVTDNDDTLKVLATVAESVKFFLNENPNAAIYAKGNTDSRTRLYRIGISNNLDTIQKNFDVLGLLKNNKWSIYEKDKDYSAFLITKK